MHADRVWMVEGCSGIGKHIAHRLVHDGETVHDVPVTLSAQVRGLATGNGRKTDPGMHTPLPAQVGSPSDLVRHRRQATFHRPATAALQGIGGA
jgi:NAD(P)-dependent dehydrogenase (short-subunit alcohol dehydrogenase family)